jgi:hypothetical protein
LSSVTTARAAVGTGSTPAGMESDDGRELDGVVDAGPWAAMV